MKQSFLVLIAIFCISSIKAQSKEYEQGVLLLVTYNLETKQEENSEKYADIIKLTKSKDSYNIYCKDQKGHFKISFAKLDGEMTYIDDNGDIFFVKDLLDSKWKALDALNSKEVPNIDSKYRMMLRVLIE